MQHKVPAIFMQLAVDDGTSIKYQYLELTKLHQVVSMLVRCCDVSSKCQSSQNTTPLTNPYGDLLCHNEYIMPIQPQAAELLFVKHG